MLTTSELMEYYKVSRQAILKWRKQGMPFKEIGPKTLRYDLEEINQWFVDRAHERKNKN